MSNRYRLHESSWIISALSTTLLVVAGYLFLQAIAGCGLTAHQQAKLTIMSWDKSTIAIRDAGVKKIEAECSAAITSCRAVGDRECDPLDDCNRKDLIFTEIINGMLEAAGAANRAVDAYFLSKGRPQRQQMEIALAKAASLFAELYQAYGRYLR